MHELSIAQSILDLATKHTPAGSVLRRVKLRAGPLRGIDPLAMSAAWQAVSSDRGRIALSLENLPWNFRCPNCPRQWTSDGSESVCACGCAQTIPSGTDELRVVGIEVDDLEPGQTET